MSKLKYWNGSAWVEAVVGAAGPTGPGVASGGTTGQILTKNSSTNYDTIWADPGAASYTTIVKQYVKNDATAKVKGDAVYISGASGTNPIVAFADADTEATSSKTLGLLEQDLAANAFGYVITEGRLSGIDTSTATDGQTVWLSGTAGGRVYGSPPSEPAHSVFLGVVTKANASTGEIFIKVQNGYEIDELHDVSAASPTAGDLLQWATDGTTYMWRKKSLADAGISATSHDHSGVYDPAGTTSTHAALTTSVHGITNTANLVYTSDLRLSDARTPSLHASTHNAGGSDALAIDAIAATGSLRTLGTTATSAAAGNHLHTGVYEASGAVATHEADTTSVHGITNTANLLTTSTPFVNMTTSGASATTISSTTSSSPTDITGMSITFTPTYDEDVIVTSDFIFTQSVAPTSTCDIISRIIVNGTIVSPYGGFTRLAANHSSPTGFTQSQSHVFAATSGTSYTVKAAAYKSAATGTFAASNISSIRVLRVRA